MIRVEELQDELHGPRRVLKTEFAIKHIPHRLPDQAQLLVVCGRRGKGKTHFLREFIEEREPRVLVLDFHEDFARTVDGGPGFRRRMDFHDALLEFDNGGAPIRRRVVPPIENGANCRDFAIEFFAACVDDLRDCLLVIDELSLYCPTANLRHVDMRPLETLILQGRRFGIRLVVACQKLNRIPGEVLSEATEIVVFQVTRPRDLDVLEEWGFEDARAIAPRLGVGQCVILRA